MNSIFITGASGFIGRSLLRKLDTARYDFVYCLTRDETSFPSIPTTPSKVQILQGDLSESKKYAPYLASCSKVVHLAAKTGKVSPEEYFEVNTKGTEILLDRCLQVGVKNFLFVSSIAAKYQDKSRYYYAQSKEIAENAVMSSGLNYTIVRPTIVIGKGAATLKSLAMLAHYPIIVVFGNGAIKIQPIFVDDLADCLSSILSMDDFQNEIFDLGGPEVISIEDFLRKIHYIYRGKEPWTSIHVPLKQLTSIISIFEKRFQSFLPINVGQLSVFKNEGTVLPNRIHRESFAQMKGIDEMLRLALS